MGRSTLQCVRRLAIALTAISCVGMSESLAEEETRLPFVVGSVRSLESVQTNIRQLFESSGHPEKAHTLEAIALLATAGRGAEGVDTTRPCGFVLELDVANDTAETTPWYFLPVSEKDGFIRLVSVFAPKLEQRKPGLYRFSPDSDYRLKLTEHWAFIYEASKTDPVFPADPAKMISETARGYDAAISMNLSTIPEELLTELPDGSGGKGGGESNAFETWISKFYRDGEELVVGYQAPRKGADGGTIIDFEFKPRGNTTSAKWLADAAKKPNRFASLVDERAVVSTKVSLPVDLIRSTVESYVADSGLQFLLEQQFRNELNADQKLNSMWKQTLQRLSKANKSLKQFDCVLSIGGAERPSVFAHQLAEAKQLEKLLSQMIKQRAGNLDEVITLNAAAHAGQNIHTLYWRTTPESDEDTNLFIGGERKVHLAFLDDAVIYTAGPDGLPQMKSAIDALRSSDGSKATKEKPAGPFEFQLALGSILKLTDKDSEFAKMALENFKTDDRVRIALESLPDRSRLRLEFEEAYPRFLGKAYAIAYEKYLMAGTLNEIPAGDIGISVLGLLASVPFGFVHFEPSFVQDCNGACRVPGGFVGGQLIGQPAQLQPGPVYYEPAITPPNVSYAAGSGIPVGPPRGSSYGTSYPSSPGRPATQEVIRHTKADLPFLIDGLKYKDEQVRLQSARMIGQLGKDAKSAVPALIEVLKQIDGESQLHSSPYQTTSEAHHIAEAIARIGTDAVPDLVKVIANQKQHVAQAAAYSLQRVDKIDVGVPALIKILQDKKADAWRKQTSLGLLAKIGKPAASAIPAVTKLLKSDDWKDRRAVIECIQRIGEPPAEVINVLIAMAKGESSSPPNGAPWQPALRRPPSASLQPVDYRVGSGPESDQLWALGQLALAGDRAVSAIPTLAELLRAERSQTRRGAAATIGAIGPKAKSALPALKRAHKLEQLLRGSNQASLKEAIEKVEGQAKPIKTL